MKKLLFPLAILLAAAACQSDPKTAATPTDEQKPKVINLEPLPEVSYADAKDWKITSGKVFWQGTKPTGSSHNGEVKIGGGTLKINEGQLLDGSVTLDMTSISTVGMDESQGKSKLEGHLKSADFFDVANHPTATFDIEEVFPSAMPDFNRTVRSVLKMKGKEGTVNVPVMWKVSGGTATAKSATFFIDRTQWGVNFKSGVLGTLKDQMIDDKILLSFELTAEI